jgi:peptidoglycan/LPS O-acetylase OafA/YrhL
MADVAVVRPPPRTARTERLPALDGLRGVAAFIVLAHHVVLAGVPLLAAVYLSGADPVLPGWAWALVRTPLHVLWSGEEIVLVFFALSGFVLAMPAVRGAALSPARYYPHRLLRLYGPVWAAIGLALASRVVVGHHAVDGASWWLNAHDEHVAAAGVLHDVTLVSGTAGFEVTSVLWSLRWEVVYSLALPLVLLVGARTRDRPGGAAALAVGALALFGAHAAPRYLPAFVLGSLMAFQVDRLRAVGATLAAPTAGNRLARGAAAVACLALLTSDWWVTPWLWLPVGYARTVLEHAVPAAVALGACLAVALPFLLGDLRRVLERPAVQWAGSRSFSLYLVHEPIVVAVAFALGGRAPVLLLAAAAIPAAVVAAELFFRVAERRIHRWSRRLGRACEEWARACRLGRAAASDTVSSTHGVPS